MSQIDSNLNKLSHFSQDNEESIVLTQLTFCSMDMIKSLAKPRGIHTFSTFSTVLPLYTFSSYVVIFFCNDPDHYYWMLAYVLCMHERHFAWADYSLPNQLIREIGWKAKKLDDASIESRYHSHVSSMKAAFYSAWLILWENTGNGHLDTKPQARKANRNFQGRWCPLG